MTNLYNILNAWQTLILCWGIAEALDLVTN
jgi:hypothetical protein